MRILSLSQDPLPDSRVEKTAYTAKKSGHVVFFAGPEVRSFSLPVKIFEKTKLMPFERKANLKIPPFWNKLKRSLRKIISEFEPDLIHAHNFVAGKLACELNMPFVYDDHEYWSISAEALEKTKLHHIVFNPYKKWLTKRWEREILEKASAVIATAETVAKEHERFNSHTFVVPNFPLLVESKGLKTNNVENKYLCSVYVGKDCTQLAPERNITGLTEIFIRNRIGKLTIIGDNELPTKPPIISLGFVNHQDMMRELGKHHIGLLPWKKHWLHKYKDPNKPYEYAHAGLLTLSTSDMINVLNNLKEFVETFEDYKDLLERLIYHGDNIEAMCEMKTNIRKFALKNLIWEKNEAEILKAYSRC